MSEREGVRAYLRHPDLAEALFIDDHGPAFLAPWREHREVAAEAGLLDPVRGAVVTTAVEWREPHELAAIPLARRPDRDALTDHWRGGGGGGG